MDLILRNLSRKRWSCSHKTHITFKYIKELWKLIKTRYSNEITNTSFLCSIRQDLISYNSRIEIKLKHLSICYTVLLHQLSFSCFCIHVHTAELIDLKLLSILSYTLLREEYRSRGTDINNRSYKYKNDNCKQTSNKSACNIHYTLK